MIAERFDNIKIDESNIYLSEETKEEYQEETTKIKQTNYLSVFKETVKVKKTNKKYTVELKL